jgi:hypothetical protein
MHHKQEHKFTENETKKGITSILIYFEMEAALNCNSNFFTALQCDRGAELLRGLPPAKARDFWTGAVELPAVTAGAMVGGDGNGAEPEDEDLPSRRADEHLIITLDGPPTSGVAVPASWTVS